MKFAQAVVTNPMIIRLKREEESLDTIGQYYIECRDQHDKFEALDNIYGSINISQTMIFCHVSCPRHLSQFVCLAIDLFLRYSSIDRASSGEPEGPRFNSRRAHKKLHRWLDVRKGIL
jgi:hypothetical protein